MSAAIYFKREAFSSRGDKLMGRNVAGETFFRALLDHIGDGTVWGLVETPHDASAFREEIAHWKSRAEPRLISTSHLPALAQPGAVFYGGPGLSQHAWERSPFGARSWSICGITHTTASHRAMDGITGLLTAPVQPWDALICTSTAVRENVVRLLETQAEFLKERLQARSFTLPQLPIIPLGVHAGDFEFSGDARAQARAALGLDDDDIAVLFVGRLSFHGKAHPIPFYLALERAAADAPPGKKVVLVEYGQFSNPAIENAFAEGAAAICPSVRRVRLDGADFRLRDTAWASADVFCSLADNIQEAFGITPVEAMAAGLPVVVTDWNGYKDTVRHGVDGFRIPTTLPAAGWGEDLAVQYQLGLDTYDRYGGYTSVVTAVDVDAVTAAFRELFASPDLRRAMGESGRRRVREVYNWPVVISLYDQLWTDLATIRARGADVARRLAPARPDPFFAFAGYPTRTLTEETLLALADGNSTSSIATVEARRKLVMIGFADTILPNAAEIRAILSAAGAVPRPASELVSSLPPDRRRVALRGLGWLLKLGILRRGDPSPTL
jgi:glycosyltransferase involved in cell wall biosynthesis